MFARNLVGLIMGGIVLPVVCIAGFLWLIGVLPAERHLEADWQPIDDAPQPPMLCQAWREPSSHATWWNCAIGEHGLVEVVCRREAEGVRCWPDDEAERRREAQP